MHSLPDCLQMLIICVDSSFFFLSFVIHHLIWNVSWIMDILSVRMQCMEDGRNHMAFFSLSHSLSLCPFYVHVGNIACTARNDSYSWCTYHVHKWYQIVYRGSNGFRYSIFFFVDGRHEKRDWKIIRYKVVLFAHSTHSVFIGNAQVCLPDKCHAIWAFSFFGSLKMRRLTRFFLSDVFSLKYSVAATGEWDNPAVFFLLQTRTKRFSGGSIFTFQFFHPSNFETLLHSRISWRGFYGPVSVRPTCQTRNCTSNWTRLLFRPPQSIVFCIVQPIVILLLFPCRCTHATWGQILYDITNMNSSVHISTFGI